MPEILISAFADEAANHKSSLEQMAALAAIGIRHYSPRFLDVAGSGEIKHVVDLNKSEYKALSRLHDEYGMSVASIGSRIGKVKLLDVDDGSKNKFVPFEKYLKSEVTSTINAANQLDGKLIRGFSFYHPRGESPEPYIAQAVDQLGHIVDLCAKAGLIYGLEVEANLIGQNGQLLAELARKVKHPNMVLIYDGANLAHQGYTPDQCYEEFLAMKPHLGWMHIKDYKATKKKVPGEAVDEESDWNFVPANVGDAAHEMVLRSLAADLPKLERKMKKQGVDGFFLELEPHLKGGGQFGGFSGPDGMGVAARALCSLLDYVGIDYRLRDFADIQAERGF